MKTNLKRNTICLLLALAMLFSSIVGLLCNITNTSVLAQTQVQITNQDFNNDKVTGAIKKPTGWTSKNSSELITSGIISLDSTIFDKNRVDKYKLSYIPSAYPSRNDDQVLMINSQDALVNTGYTSSDFTLEKNSYYKLTFKAYTESTDARKTTASANLLGNSVLENSVINIITEGAWTEYTFLIATDNIVDTTANLELWLGAKNGVKSYGSVLFDEIRLYKISSDSFESLSNTLSSDRAKIIDFTSELSPSQFANNSFENSTLTDWQALTKNDSSLGNANNYSGLITFNNGDYEALYKLSQDISSLGENINALLINNNEASSIGYKSSTITLQQHHTYKISFLVNANIESGKASAILVANGKKYTLEISTTSTASWTEYSFYVQGHSFKDAEAYLELWLGESEISKGYVLFDEIKVYPISTSEYESGISGSNALEVDLAPQSSLSVSNGMFNLVENDSRNSSYPFTPQDWTQNGGDKNTIKSGIINTQDVSMISQIFNPSSSYENNNILMIGNLGKIAQTYTTSSTISLSSSSYYKLTFKVQTQGLDANAKAGFRIYADNFTIKEILDISTQDQEWTTYTIYIHTSTTSLNAKIELSLGKYNSGLGFAFFDDISLISTTESMFNSNSNANTYKVDLASDDFTNVSTKKDGIYTSNTFKEENANGSVISGVIDVNEFETFFVGETNPNLPTNIKGNLLMIRASDDVSYSLLSNQKYSLSSGSYYKISVWVKTMGLSQSEGNKVLVKGSTTEYYPMGATITLTDINKTFSGINTNGEWTEYIYYINSTDSADIQVKLGLGSDNAKTKGIVYFTNLSIQEIESNDYYTNVAPLEDDATITNIMAVGSTKVEETPTESTTSDPVNFDWLLVPTLISALALVIAIIGVAVRKFAKKHPRPVRIKTSDYKRENSLEKEYEHLQAIKKQQEKMEKLQVELDEIKAQLNASKAEFKQQEKQNKQRIENTIKLKKKEAIKQEKQLDVQDAKQIKAQSKAEIKAYRQQQHEIFKKEKYTAYLAKQAELQRRFDMIEAEIEAIYQEELRLIKLYKEYKKAVRLKKQELKLQNKIDKK